MSFRIYVVTDKKANPITHRLVRSGNNSAARNFAARDQFEVEVAGQQTLVDLLAAGVKIEDATEAAS